MKLIQTSKNIPSPQEDEMFDHKSIINESHEQQQQDSLAIRLQKPQPLTTPSKKRRSGCICKKTLCLKMYCQCFASGKKCTDQCNCCDCSNTEQNEKLISEAKLSVKDKGMHSCSLAQKKCNCKKSSCQKKYCQCFNAGILCSAACKCVGCCNSHQENPENPNKSEGDMKKTEKLEVNSRNFLQKSLNNLEGFCQ